MKLSISQLRLDGGTQPRDQLNMIVIAEYAEAMRSGAEFPPVEAMYDGSDYWLWDGFHRVEAARLNGDGAASLEANIRQGTRRDAVLASAGANVTHGQRRTNADKRRAVLALLADAEWSAWADNEISRRCAVSAGMVGQLRAEVAPRPVIQPAEPATQPVVETARRAVSTTTVAGKSLPEARKTERAATRERTVKRGGKTYNMKTAKIGKGKTSKSKPAAKIAKEMNKAQIAGKVVQVERVVTAPVHASPVCPACAVEPMSYTRQHEDAWRCGNCGASVVLSVALASAAACPSCGKPVNQGAAYCANCGEVIR